MYDNKESIYPPATSTITAIGATAGSGVGVTTGSPWIATPATVPWGSGTGTIPASSPSSYPDIYVGTPGEKFMERVNTNAIPQLLFAAQGAISEHLRTNVAFSIRGEFNEPTNTASLFLTMVTNKGAKTLIKMSRRAVRPDEDLYRPLLDDVMEMAIVGGLINMVKAELGLNNQPEF